jgi:hypothetical protein
VGATGMSQRPWMSGADRASVGAITLATQDSPGASLQAAEGVPAGATATAFAAAGRTSAATRASPALRNAPG